MESGSGSKDSTNKYELKLYNLFKSHDHKSTGSLDRDALLKLCITLDLKERGETLVKSLITKNHKRVTFQEFRECLLNILEGASSDSPDQQANNTAPPTMRDYVHRSYNLNNNSSNKAMATATTTATAASTVTTSAVPATTATPSTTKVNGSDDSESDREVQPKFVVGNKKYGRKSRPRETEELTSPSDSDNDAMNATVVEGAESQKVQRSASQSEIHGTKRGRPIPSSKLKRCASLPVRKSRQTAQRLQHKIDAMQQETAAANNSSLNAFKPRADTNFEHLAQIMKELWSEFGSDCALSVGQLEVVFKKFGLQDAAASVAVKEVFKRLDLTLTDCIGFADFIELIKSEDFGAASNMGASGGSILSPIDSRNGSELDIGVRRCIADKPIDTGSIDSDVLIGMWEAAGIPNAYKLLVNLGFNGKSIELTELSDVIDEKLQHVEGGQQQSVPLLKASLALLKAQVNALHLAFRQVADENKKLYTDNKEANRRADLLAQEIDERHSSIENTTKSEIRMLEQRQNEVVRDLTTQLTVDREQWTTINARQEKRIKLLEMEEQRLKHELAKLQTDNEQLEQEQTDLHKQVTDLYEQNIRLNREIIELEDKQKDDDYRNEKDNDEILALINKVSGLQTENSNLRDKNDELSAEVETANMELIRLRKSPVKVSRTANSATGDDQDGNDASSCESDQNNSSAAIKRRGDSPSKTRISEESPRLGKVRKYSNDSAAADNESLSGDWMALNSELGQNFQTAPTENSSSGISPDCSSMGTQNQEQEIRDLKAKVAELEKMVSTSTSGDTIDTNAARCKELERNLEQMAKEFENCEDYWQSKLNEERQLYEDEQRQSDEKFNELLKKMGEYEEQFATVNEKNDGRCLSPIEEKCQLEQQYEELEAEAEEIRSHAEMVLKERANEVRLLRLKVQTLEQKLSEISDFVPSTPPRIETPDHHLFDSPASSPINYLWSQSTITQPVTRDYTNPNFTLQQQKQQQQLQQLANESVEAMKQGENSENPIVPMISDIRKSISPIQKPSSVKTAAAASVDEHDVKDEMCSISSRASSMSEKSVGTHSLASTHNVYNKPSSLFGDDPVASVQDSVKKMRLIELNLKDEIKDLAHQRDCLSMELQQLREAKPILAKAYARTQHPNVTLKIQQLEQSRRQLMSALKNQQLYTENILAHTWQKQCGEIKELRNRLEAQSILIGEQANRLANADMLVKDLYIENSHLSANIQRLEQQRARQALLQLNQQMPSNFSHHGHGGGLAMP